MNAAFRYRYVKLIISQITTHEAGILHERAGEPREGARPGKGQLPLRCAEHRERAAEPREGAESGKSQLPPMRAVLRDGAGGLQQGAPSGKVQRPL